MIGALLIIVGLCYFGAGIGYFINGNPGMGLAFICYAIANYGLFKAG